MDQSTSNDGVPRVWRGEAANLDPLILRAAPLDAPAGPVQEHPSVTPTDEFALADAMTVKATWQTEDSTVFHHDEGRFYVTTERILFVSNWDKNHNVAVDAGCIQLHAVSEDSVYIQMQESEDSTSIEFTITPNKQDECQVLFDALSKLVSMHPIPLDDDEDNGLMDDAIFAPPADAGASEEEREAILERLDNMLVVPPEYEVTEEAQHVVGQFEDAEDDDDEDEAML